MRSKPLISIVDDDESWRVALAGLVESLGFAVADFPSAADFLASSYLDHSACLIADINMPGMTGLQLHQRLVKSGQLIPTILITAYPDPSVRSHALAEGAVSYLSKPCTNEALLACIRKALKQRP